MTCGGGFVRDLGSDPKRSPLPGKLFEGKVVILSVYGKRVAFDPESGNRGAPTFCEDQRGSNDSVTVSVGIDGAVRHFS